MEIKKADVTEIKSLSSPPILVIKVLKATVTLLGVKHVEEFRYVKRIVSSSTFLQDLSKLDIDSIPRDTASRAQCLIDGITKEEIRNVNRAAASFLQWVKHILARAEKRTGDLSVATKPEPTA